MMHSREHINRAALEARINNCPIDQDGAALIQDIERHFLRSTDMSPLGIELLSLFWPGISASRPRT